MCVKIRIFLIFPHIKIKKFFLPKKFLYKERNLPKMFLYKERNLPKKFLYKERFLPKKFLYKEISSLYEKYDYFCNRKLHIKISKIMKTPKFLPAKGIIAIVAPSMGCTVEPGVSRLNAAIKRFESMGYKVLESPNCRKNVGIGISNTPESCGRELMDFYCNTNNDILIACSGGELMCEILDFVDFEAIKNAPPKWFMGFSDNTNFTFLLNTICDVASVYGSNIGSFGTEELHVSQTDAIDILSGRRDCVEGYDKFELLPLKSETNPYVGLNLTEIKQLRLFVGGNETDRELEFEGRITGGCLDILATLVGTKYDQVKSFNSKYKSEGVIWFFEACDLSVFAIRRALWTLDHAGWFATAKGFIVGRPNAAWTEENMGLNQYNAVLDIVGKYNVPIVMDADLSHIPPSMPIVSGAYAKVRAGENLRINFD